MSVVTRTEYAPRRPASARPVAGADGRPDVGGDGIRVRVAPLGLGADGGAGERQRDRVVALDPRVRQLHGRAPGSWGAEPAPPGPAAPSFDRSRRGRAAAG